MPTQRRSKWSNRHKTICHKFEDAVEGTRGQTEAFWDGLALPRVKPVNRKPKPIKPKGSHNKVKEKLKAIAYRQVEDRDEEKCLVCMSQGIEKEARSHHHIIKQSTRYAPEYIQRMENVACVCTECHDDIHRPKTGKSAKQTYLEGWQQRYYPEYSEMMRELVKVTGCRDEWIIARWQNNNKIATGGR